MSGLSFTYEVVRSPKRKRVAISVREGTVRLHAPMRVSLSRLEQWLHSKSAWVEAKLAAHDAMMQRHAPRHFVDGESFLFRGDVYALQRFDGDMSLHLRDQSLHLYAPDWDGDALRACVTQWYQEQARCHVQQRAAYWAALLGLQPRLVDVKHYKSRWGACFADGRIYVHWALIMAPDVVLDYVLVHELAHLRHMNHSAAFWQLVSQYMPDHRAHRAWLKREGAMLRL